MRGRVRDRRGPICEKLDDTAQARPGNSAFTRVNGKIGESPNGRNLLSLLAFLVTERLDYGTRGPAGRTSAVELFSNDEAVSSSLWLSLVLAWRFCQSGRLSCSLSSYDKARGA